MAPAIEVKDIEILEDFSSTARCDEGFLRLRRLRCRNRRGDGSVSPTYRVDVVDRPSLDAVAVVLHRAGDRGREVLTRRTLRPAAHFRSLRPQLSVEEVVAGVLEP